MNPSNNPPPDSTSSPDSDDDRSDESPGLVVAIILGVTFVIGVALFLLTLILEG